MGRRRSIGVVLLALSLMVVVGCASDARSGVTAQPAATPPEPDTAPEADPRPDGELDGGPDGGPDGRPDGGPDVADVPDPQRCEAGTLAAIGATVSTQLDAFAADDFPLAYAMTSPFFRRLLAPDAFEALIRDTYPELVGNDGHRLDGCRSRGRRGFLIVGVRAGTQEIVLRYDLSEEEDGWRIDGARRLTDVMLPQQPLV
jgi:hypothetical protein